MPRFSTLAPNAMTSGSRLSSIIRSVANMNIKAPSRVIIPAAIIIVICENRLATSLRFAPRLWPTSVVAASSIPYPGM